MDYRDESASDTTAAAKSGEDAYLRPLTERELIDAATLSGATPPTRPQLRRWYRHGLIPRPRQDHPSGVRGSQSIYPPGSLPQLLALLRLHSTTKPLALVRFELWWEGFPIDPKHVRRTIRQLARAELEPLSGLARRHRDPLDVADAIVSTRSESGLRSPLGRLFRRRLGRDEAEFESLVSALVVLLLGDQPEWESSDVGTDERSISEILTRALGFAPGTSPVPADTTPSLSSLEVPGLFERLAEVGATSSGDPFAVVSQASDEELEQARVDAKVLFEFCTIAEAAELWHGRDAFGWGVFAILGRERDRPWWRLILIRVSILLRRIVPLPNIEEFHQAVRNAFPQANSYLAVWSEFPQYRDFLRYDGTSKIEELKPHKRDEMFKSISEFVDRTPDIAETIGV